MIGQVLDNFIDDDFIEWLTWFWDQCPNRVDTGQRYRAFLNHQLGWNHRLHEKLRQLICPYEQSFDLTTAYLSDDYAPGGVHSDGWIPGYPATNLSRTYLVPLKIASSNHTVIFKQSSEEAVTFNSSMGMGNKGIVNYRQVDTNVLLEQNNDHTIPKDIYDRYLKHLPYEKLSGLSVDCVLPWRVGSAITWPRKYFHCSADYDRSCPRFSLILMTSCNTRSY